MLWGGVQIHLSIPANGTAASLHEVLRVFSRIAIKYQQEYGRLPVLIIDNVNNLDRKHPGLLDPFQDYAKRDADKGDSRCCVCVG
jgi:hypothetical protein